MDHFLHHYQTRLEEIMPKHNYLILDNIFPVPLCRKGRENVLDDLLTISRSTILAAWWKRTFQEEAGKIMMPWEIYIQAFQRYGIVTKSNHNLSFSQQENSDALEKYLGAQYALLSEARKHIFRTASGGHDVYASVAAKFREMTLAYHLKKENHHDDKGADESIVAAASYLMTQKNARCAIITNDGDIDRIVDRCIPESEKKLMTVYHPPRMENHRRYHSSSHSTHTPNAHLPTLFL